jgi:hypothetical protein
LVWLALIFSKLARPDLSIIFLYSHARQHGKSLDQRWQVQQLQPIPAVHSFAITLSTWLIRLSSQALLFIKLLQRLHHFPHIPRDDRIQLVQRQIDAMIGQAILREVVGANPLTASR